MSLFLTPAITSTISPLEVPNVDPFVLLLRFYCAPIFPFVIRDQLAEQRVSNTLSSLSHPPDVKYHAQVPPEDDGVNDKVGLFFAGWFVLSCILSIVIGHGWEKSM